LTDVAGVDDAGRGPIIGPLVIAGIMIPRERVRDLREMGVKDSKMLTPFARKQLRERIMALAKVSVREAQPREIDDVVFHGVKLKKLNFLEARMMAEVISDLRPPEVYVDASDVNEERFGETIRSFLSNDMRNIKIVSKHHADKNYLPVSAASIIAKTHRDHAIELLHNDYGDFGSGYITDPKTMEFLRQYRRSHSEYPPIVRVSWKTAKEVEDELGQSRLGA